MKIFKYLIETTDNITLELPKGYKILNVQTQWSQVALWALVEPGNNIEQVRLRVFGTGQPIPDSIGKYIGTYQLNGGAMVFHVFEEF